MVGRRGRPPSRGAAGAGRSRGLGIGRGRGAAGVVSSRGVSRGRGRGRGRGRPPKRRRIHVSPEAPPPAPPAPEAKEGDDGEQRQERASKPPEEAGPRQEEDETEDLVRLAYDKWKTGECRYSCALCEEQFRTTKSFYKVSKL